MNENEPNSMQSQKPISYVSGVETTIIRMGSLMNLNIFSTAATICRVRSFIKKKNIDLVHTDAPRQTFYAGIAARMIKKPSVWHVRVSNPEKKLYDKFLFAQASKVIAVSRAASKRFEELALESDKVAVIYNGADLTEFGQLEAATKLKEEFNIEDDWTLVGTLGQLIPSKGQDVFLRVERLFSIEKNVAQIERIYEALLCQAM